MADALRNGRVNGILAHIALGAMVVGGRVVVLGQRAALHLVLMRRVPGARDHLATPAHGLRIRTHHADGARVVQHVLGRDGLGPDATVRERDVLGDILRQVVARHDHVQVLVHRVARVRLGRVRAAGQHVDVLHQRDHVRRVAPAGAFDVVRVHGAVLEGVGRAFDKAGFVQRVAVDLALDVEFVTDADTVSPIHSGGAETEKEKTGRKHLKQVSMAEGVHPQSSCSLSPATPAWH